ncbi:MAG: 6-bladed beta-propeller [Bacteroidota bacterium]
MKILFPYHSIFLITIFVYFFHNANCQDTLKISGSVSLETAEVKWVNQWPLSKESGVKTGVKEWLKRIILGEKTPALSKPISVLAVDTNSLWVLDQGNNAVFKVGKKLSGTSSILKTRNVDFQSLIGICAFQNNEVLFTDSYLNKIFIVPADKKACEVLNDSLVLEQPTGIAYSKLTGQIWVVETSAHRISVLNEKGELIKRIGKRGTAFGDFNYPTNIWIDNEGNIYIIDSMNFRVQVLNKDGEVISVFGTSGDASGYFARPKGIATDSYGNIYVSDALFHVVQIFDINGNFLYKFGSQGQDEGQFWMPSGIYIDADDYIYVADSYNSRVQIFQLTNCVKK